MLFRHWRYLAIEKTFAETRALLSGQMYLTRFDEIAGDAVRMIRESGTSRRKLSEIGVGLVFVILAYTGGARLGSVLNLRISSILNVCILNDMNLFAFVFLLNDKEVQVSMRICGPVVEILKWFQPPDSAEEFRFGQRPASAYYFL